MSVEKVSFKIENDCVELNVDGSAFNLSLDERGVPQFPESVKQQLPPYMPEMVEKLIKSKRQSPNQGPAYMALWHEPWCPELRGTGKCNCNYDLCDLEIGDYSGISEGKLTCKMCNESSTGEKIRYEIVEDENGCWERFWIQGGDMFYWLVNLAGTERPLLICHLCMMDPEAEFSRLAG
jgi:hypothetical protein